MADIIRCPIKINVTLHVLDRRADGYHELRSVFWKKMGNETIRIEKTNIASLDVNGAKIEGKNLLSSVIEFASCKINVPTLSLRLCKKYPQGSGIGAGSGNAAALLLWLKENCGLEFSAEESAKLGADISVLAQASNIYYAEGVGERLTELPELEGLHWLLIFPKWSSNTAEAYGKLDEIRKGYAIQPADFFSEAQILLKKLEAHEQTGLLPNDFLKVAMTEHDEYSKAFEIANQCGALAWGMCGSGSAMFMLSDDMEKLEKIEGKLNEEKWIASAERLD